MGQRMVRKMVAVLLCAGTLRFAEAQTPRKPLEFEVATIKPHPPGDNSSSTNLVNGGVDATNVTLRQLIVRAFEVQEYQVIGGPSWISEERWDLMARTPDFVMPENPGALSDAQRRSITDQMQERLRSLLAERFQLRTRIETKEQPIYALVVAKNGPKLQENTARDRLDSVSTNGSNGVMTSTFSAVTMERLAQQLARRTERPVVDKTGIQGRYDFKLEWMELRQSEAAAGTNPSDPQAPAIFTAVQEQLGLKLESQKGPVEVIVIESVQKPSEN